MVRVRASVVGVVLVALISGCTSTRAASRDTTPAQTVTLPVPGVDGGLEVSGPLRIFVAAEMRPVAEALERAFTEANPDAEVTFTFGEGKVLIVQAVGGPVPDFYFASAVDVAGLNVYLPDVQETGFLGADEYVIATPRGNPGGVTDLATFEAADGTAVCTPGYLLPEGQTPPEALPVNAESDPACSTATANLVAAGDLTAAVLPRTGLGRRRGTVAVVEVPPEDNITVNYRYARLTDKPVSVGFENYLGSRDARRLRARFGYRA